MQALTQLCLGCHLREPGITDFVDTAKVVEKLHLPPLQQAQYYAMAARPQLPGFAQRELNAWMVDAKGWQQERFSVSRQTSTQLFARARLLIDSTGAATNTGAMPQHFIALLRAATYLDEAMRRQPQAKFRGEALFLLGVAHATITDNSLWQLEWMYFEACIRENAASARGAACAARLEERTRFIWQTPSDVPSSTQVALKDLVKLAKVQKN